MARTTEFADGEVLRKLREKKRLPRAKAAVLIGVSEKRLQDWELHDASITWTSSEKLAKFYEVPPEELVIPEEKRRDPAPATTDEEAAETVITTGEQALEESQKSDETVHGSPGPKATKHQAG
jgi:transcriptional regulator with XRE-family HTH domain